jgi:N-acetylglucosaminyldiphosphoundecaprenol N-acetyl-beta-D-mannosaminyltransferase
MHDLDLSQPRANVLGVNVSAINLDLGVNLADEWIRAARGHGYICAAGVHGVMEANADPELRQVMNRACISIPDGMPMVWVGRLQGFRDMDRVFGPDFMLALCRLSVERGYRSFLYGGKPGVAEQLRTNLQEQFPGLQVVGTYTPPFRSLTAKEKEDLLGRVLEAKPHIMWVGLSTPKQERFMAEYVKYLQVPLMVGVGAAFDYHTGSIHDCSPWVKRAGLQWLHRLRQEPGRLWRRYLYSNPAFLWHIALQFLRLREYPSALEDPLDGKHRENSDW